MPAARPCLDDPEIASLPVELLVARMKSRFADADLDCSCREEIENSLDDFAKANANAAFDAELMRARAMREAIAKLCGYLVDLDELDASERDISVFGEIAGVFEDVSSAAETGAAAMRIAVFNHPRRSESEAGKSA